MACQTQEKVKQQAKIMAKNYTEYEELEQ